MRAPPVGVARPKGRTEMKRNHGSAHGLLLAAACLALTACASSGPATNEKDPAYERPEYTTGSNLARKDRNAANVKLVDKDAFQSSLSANPAATQGGKN